jgi:transposase
MSIPVMYERCAGLDVHQQTVQACVRCLDSRGNVTEHLKEFGTMTAELAALRDFLAKHGVTHVAMESTGVYWLPIFNILEESCAVTLCNAQQVKKVPGRKTDVTDSQWLAQLMSCGLLRGSFIPPKAQRQLRELTRARVKLEEDRARVVNRVHKILERAGIKLASVATDIMGKTGRAILQGLMQGQQNARTLAAKAKGRLKEKKKELQAALHVKFEEHDRFLLMMQWQQLLGLEELLAVLDERIDWHIRQAELSPRTNVKIESGAAPKAEGTAQPKPAKTAAVEKAPLPYTTAIALLDEVPGINSTAAQSILAETGTDMKQFPSAGHLASWCGICPGNNESAGKRHSGKTPKGNRWLRRILTEAAWGATRKKGSYYKALYGRLARRRGKKRALVAIAHSLLVTIYHMLNEHRTYADLGATYLDSLAKERTARNLKRRLEALGYTVTLAPNRAA